MDDDSALDISYLMGRLSLQQVKQLSIKDADASEVSRLIKSTNRNVDLSSGLYLLKLACATKNPSLVISALNLLPREALKHISVIEGVEQLTSEALKCPSNNSRVLYFLSNLSSLTCDSSLIISSLEASKNVEESVSDYTVLLRGVDGVAITDFLQRLLKKSTATTLDVCLLFVKAKIHESVILQTVKSSLLSDNDETRDKAVCIASQCPADSQYLESLIKEALTKNFKVKNSVLKVAQAWSPSCSADTLSPILLPLLDKETNEETLGAVFSCLINLNVDFSSWIDKKLATMKPSLRIALCKASLYATKNVASLQPFLKMESLSTEKSFQYQEILLLTAVYLKHELNEDAKRLFKRYFGLSNGPFSAAHLESADPLATFHVLKHFYCDTDDYNSKEALAFTHSAFTKFATTTSVIRRDLEMASRKSMKHAKALLEYALKEKICINRKLQRIITYHVDASSDESVLLVSNFTVFTEFTKRTDLDKISVENVLRKMSSAQCDRDLVIQWLSKNFASELFSILLKDSFVNSYSILAMKHLKSANFTPSNYSDIFSYLSNADISQNSKVLYALLNFFGLCLPFSLLLKAQNAVVLIDGNWFIRFEEAIMKESARDALIANGSAFALWLLMKLPRNELQLTKGDCENMLASIQVFDAQSMELALKFAVIAFEHHPILADAVISMFDKIILFPCSDSLAEVIKKLSLSEESFVRRLAHLTLKSLSECHKNIAICRYFLSSEFEENCERVDLNVEQVVEQLKQTPTSAVEVYGKAVAAILSIDSIKKVYQVLLDARIPEGPKQRIKAGTDLTANGRKALAIIFEFAPVTDQKFVNDFFLDLAFMDPNEEVADAFLNCFTSMVGKADKANCIQILNVFEEILQKALKDQSDRLGIYLMVGITALTRKVYYDESAASIAKRNQLCLKLVERLTAALSEPVQKAIADAMVSILQIGRLEQYECIPGFLEKCMTALGDGKAGIGLRRGCAFGLAAICSVGGLRFLCEHQFVSQFTKWLAEGSTGQKVGALYAVELLSFYLGALFEPFAIQLAPFVMSSFSGGSGASGEELREASSDAAVQLISCSLSSIHGVKILLPRLLDELMNSSSWRTRVATIEWLGQMSAINRASLAPYLPLIVPALVQHGLIDAHPQVQKAAMLALTQYGRSIRSPEIQKLFPRILDALSDPEKNLNVTLDTILETNFSHAVDGSSLALVAPLLTRALTASSDKATESKKKAAQIIGNLGSLVDVRELKLLLKSLLEALLHALGDANPSVRAVSAKVVGVLSSLVPNDSSIQDFESQCLQLFRGEKIPGAGNALFRAGAASAVAELLANRPEIEQAAAGVEFVLELFHARPAAASANLVATEMMALFAGCLPEAFGERLEQIYEAAELKKTLLPLVLRDMVGGDGTVIMENELIRASATQAAHKMVTAFALIDPSGLFEEIVEGALDARWKVRLLSLELLADYVSQVFAVGDNEEAGDELRVLSDCPAAEELKTLLPEDAVNRLTAAIFLARFDSNGQIKSMGFGFWRGIASHPVRAVSDCIPFLVSELCRCLKSSEELSEVDISIEALVGLGERAEAAFAVVLEMCRRMLEKTAVPMAKALLDALLGSESPFTPLALVCFLLQAVLTHAQNGLSHSEKMVVLVQLVPVLREILLFDTRDSSETLVALHAFAFELLLEMVQTVGGSSDTLQSFVEEMVQGRKERFDVLLPLVRARPYLLVPILLRQIMQPNSLETMDIKDSKLRRLFLNAGDDLSPFVLDLVREHEAVLSQCSVETVGLLLSSLQSAEREFGRVMQYLLSQPRPLVFYFALLPHLNFFEDDRMAIYRLILQNNATLSGAQVDMLLTQAPEFDFVNLAVMLSEHSRPADEKALDVRVRRIIVPLLINRSTCAKGIPMIAQLVQDEAITLSSSLVIALMGALIRMTSEKDLGLSIELCSALVLLLEKYPMQAKPFYPQLQRVFVNSLDLPGLRLLLSVSPRPEPLLSDLCKLCATNIKSLPILQLMADWKKQGGNYDFSTLKNAHQADPALVAFLLS